MNKHWNDRADRDLFFTILSVKNIGVISGPEWRTIGNHMRCLGYGFTNEGCRQHFQGLRRAQSRAEAINLAERLKIDPTHNPITRRPGPGRGRPRKQQQQQQQQQLATHPTEPQPPVMIPRLHQDPNVNQISNTTHVPNAAQEPVASQAPHPIPNATQAPNDTHVPSATQVPNATEAFGATQPFHTHRLPPKLHPPQLSGAPVSAGVLQSSKSNPNQRPNVSQGPSPTGDLATAQGANPPHGSTTIQGSIPPRDLDNVQGASIPQSSPNGIPQLRSGSASEDGTASAAAPAPASLPSRDTTSGPGAVPSKSPTASSHAPPHRTPQFPASSSGIIPRHASEEPGEDERGAKRQKVAPAEDQSLHDEAVLALAAHEESPTETYPSPTDYPQPGADQAGDLGESAANPFNYGEA